MKTLKEHIIEGLLDIENNINVDMTEDVIKDFLEENYDIKWCSYTIKNIKRKFIVDVKGNIMVKNKDITSLTNEFFEFGSVSENFNCHACESLTSLQGAPKEVGGRFCCNWCNSLKNLEGAPKKVGGDFDCAHCDNLTSLKGAPQKVDGGFDCDYNDSLTSLEGAPKKVGGGFDCGHCKSLTSLIGGPKEVGGNFYCIYCESLRSLEGAPKKVGGDFCCNNCGVKFKTVEIKKYVKTAKYIRA